MFLQFLRLDDKAFHTVGPAWKMARSTVWNMELVQEKVITSELPN